MDDGFAVPERGAVAFGPAIAPGNLSIKEGVRCFSDKVENGFGDSVEAGDLLP